VGRKNGKHHRKREQQSWKTFSNVCVLRAKREQVAQVGVKVSEDAIFFGIKRGGLRASGNSQLENLQEWTSKVKIFDIKQEPRATANDGFKTQQQRLNVQDLHENFVNKDNFGSAHEKNARKRPQLWRFRVRFLWIKVCAETQAAESPEDEAWRRKSRQIRVRCGRESFRHKSKSFESHELPSNAIEEVRDLWQRSKVYGNTHAACSSDKGKVEVWNLQETSEDQSVSAGSHESASESSSVSAVWEEVHMEMWT
jgi:hypothetical protein